MPVDLPTFGPETHRTSQTAFQRLKAQHDALEKQLADLKATVLGAPKPPSFADIAKALSASGSNPLNITSLPGTPTALQATDATVKRQGGEIANPGPPPGTIPPPDLPPPQPPASPPPGGGAAGTLIHGFNLALATVFNSPGDIATWSVTGTITAVSIFNGAGVYVTCNKVGAQNATPPPPGSQWPLLGSAENNIQYTVWIVLKIGGVWYTSGFIQMWYGRPGTGSFPVGPEFANNWAYDSRWGAMNGYMPAVGEQVGVFVSAGNARGVGGVTTVRERSEVVLLNLPDANGANYT